MYRKISEEMLDFVKHNPTAFHVVASIGNTLKENEANIII